MVGSCDGLVCVCSYEGEFLVTNPSTREVRKLPMPPLYKDMEEEVPWGFGYDSSTHDYKVVVGFNESEHHTRFQVLSLKSNEWRFIGDGHYSSTRYNTDYSNVGFLYDGTLHCYLQKVWLMKNYNCWQLLPHEYYGADATACILDRFPDNTWRICDDGKGNVYLLERWYHIANPTFVKSLVSPNPTFVKSLVSPNNNTSRLKMDSSSHER
ncbi:F-box/kelch-repeat protein At3g06240-like [Rutidosis leptorrhynchoides]|uniref:F-box/kelch-repeat protein At3g06240-like n=1 Tax=Rutidosis leptorrhynchoides TaxID=125765 RepID=UPI003A99F04C